MATRGANSNSSLGCGVSRDPGLVVAWRVAVAFLGGYALAAGMIAFLGSFLSYMGLPTQEALAIGVFVGLITFITAGLGMFATRTPWRHGFAVIGACVLILGLATVI